MGMIKIFRILFTVLLAVSTWSIFSGMARPGKRPLLEKTAAVEKQVEKALFMLERRYESRNTQEFRGLLDDDFRDKLNFLSSLDDYFLASKRISIRIVTDSLSINRGKIYVRLHWFKKVLNDAGSFVKTEGLSEFIFRRKDKSLTLLEIRKDNPFF